MVVVRRVTVDPRRVVNLTSPRRDAAIVQDWAGLRDWHDPLYEPLRDRMEAFYVAAFDAANGHYRRLEADIRAHGIRNPVMLVSGRLQRRRPDELPPAWRGRADLLVSEYLGGSRLLIAERLRLPVPAIVNDFADLFPKAPALGSAEEVAACFADRPGHVAFSAEEGATVNDMVYAHMPAGYSLRAQIPIRRRIVGELKAMVAAWLRENDRP